MPYLTIAEEIRVLRDKAERLRDLADSHPTPLSSKLIEMAAELDLRADVLTSRLGHFQHERQPC